MTTERRVVGGIDPVWGPQPDEWEPMRDRLDDSEWWDDLPHEEMWQREDEEEVTIWAS